jgi:two-component system cell cycle sensor histidine kinase/response regulator CckA
MAASSDSRAPQHGATILAVDDEETVLSLVRTMLWRAGYNVLEASGGAQALRIASENGAPIHLLLSDILMPDMNGYELADKLQALRPDTKVLFMSGYRDKVLAESTGRAASASPLLRKPFTQHNLIERIEQILEGTAVGAEQPEL